MENPIAKFRFLGFSIQKSAIEIKDPLVVAPEMSLNIGLKGEHITKECRYNLYMKIEIMDKKESIKAMVEAVGSYEFDNDCQDKGLSNYFYINAPAILFPYIRAYIATLSTLSGLASPVMMPTMNLTKFAEELAKKTKKV